MSSLRIRLIGLSFLFASNALADEAPPPPPDFGDCVVAKQQKSPADQCEVCDNIYQDGCEKKYKDKGFVRSCQIKPKNAAEWREVWCKGSATAPKLEPATLLTEPKKEEPKVEPAKAGPAREVTETTRQGGCAVDPNASGSLLSLGLFALLMRRRRS